MLCATAAQRSGFGGECQYSEPLRPEPVRIESEAPPGTTLSKKEVHRLDYPALFPSV